MPRPIELQIILRVLVDNGFVLIREKGSHGRFRKIGNPARYVTVKMTSREIPYGTFVSIVRQSGLKKEEFL